MIVKALSRKKKLLTRDLTLDFLLLKILLDHVLHHISHLKQVVCYSCFCIGDAFYLKIGIIFRCSIASASNTFQMIEAVNVTIKNEVTTMEDDDTLVLTPEERDKILKELPQQQKDDEDQEEE
jgi:hypothetical protein